MGPNRVIDSRRLRMTFMCFQLPKITAYESLITLITDADFIKVSFRLLTEHTKDACRL